jgi:hypothetical protein
MDSCTPLIADLWGTKCLEGPGSQTLVTTELVITHSGHCRASTEPLSDSCLNKGDNGVTVNQTNPLWEQPEKLGGNALS